METMDVDTFLREGLAGSDSDEGVVSKPIVKKGNTKKSQGQKRREKMKLQSSLKGSAKKPTVASQKKTKVDQKKDKEPEQGVTKPRLVVFRWQFLIYVKYQFYSHYFIQLAKYLNSMAHQVLNLILII